MSNDLKIKLSVEGGAQVASALNSATGRMEQMGQASRTASAHLSDMTAQLGQFAGALGAVASVQKAVTAASDYSALTARMTLLVGSAEKAAQAMQTVNDIALRQGASLLAVGDSYAKIGQAMTVLGGGALETSRVVETVAAALRLGNASTQEAASAMRQFGQAMAKGKLNGDEFVALLENAPYLMDAVAASLGKTKGDLFAMAEAGQLTASVFSNAVLNSFESVTQKAATLPQTIGQAMENVTTSFTKAAGESQVVALASGAAMWTMGEAAAHAGVILDGVAKGAMVMMAGAALKVAESQYIQLTSTLAASAANTAHLTSTVASAEAKAIYTGIVLAEARATLASTTGMAASVVAQTALVAATGAHTVAIAAQTAAQNALNTATSIGSKALGLLGGPIGIITTLLGLGITAWAIWGSGAETAADKATKAATKLQDAQIEAARLHDALERNPKNLFLKSATEKADALVKKLTQALDLTNGGGAGRGRVNPTTVGDAEAQREQDRAAFASSGTAYFTKAQKEQAALTKEIDASRAMLERGSISAKEYADRLIAVRASFADKGKVSTAATSAKTAAQKGVELYNDLISQSSGYTKDWAEKVGTLSAAFASGGIKNLDEFNAALAVLNSQQPGAIKAAKATQEIALAMEAYEVSVSKAIAASAAELAQAQAAFDAHGKLKSVLAEEDLARLEVLRTITLTAGDDTRAVDAQIANRKKLVAIFKNTELRDASEKAAKEAQAAWDKTSDSIRDSLTDAFLSAADSGKNIFDSLAQALKNQFNNLVLRPIVSAVMNPIAQGITGALGLSGAANAGDGLMGTAGMASNAYSLFNGASSLLTVGSQVAAGSMSLANALGTVGANATGTGISGLLATNGAYGTAAAGSASAAAGSFSTVLAAIPVWGWAAMAVAAIGDFSGGREETTGTGITGKFSRAGFAGSSYQDWHNSGSRGFFGIGASGSSSGTNYSAMSKDMTQALGASFLAMQDQTAGFAQALGLSSTAIKGFSTSVRLNLGADAEANKKAIDGMLKGLADKAANLVLDPAFAKKGEAASDTLARLAISLSFTNSTFDVLGKTLLSVSQAGGSVASSLVEGMGGLDAAKSAFNAYYQRYYSGEERVAKTREQTTAALEAMGLVMPSTLAGYRALVNAQEITTDKGRATFAVLIGLSEAFAQVADAAKTAEDAQKAAQKATQDFSAAMGKTVTSAFSELRDLVESAERDLVDAFNNASGALADTAERFGSIQGIFKDFAQSLTGSAGVGQSLAYLRGEFTRLSDLARLGDAGAASKAVGVGDQLAARILATASSRREADIQLASLAAQANVTSSIAEQQKSIAQQQLDVLKDVVGKLVDVEGKTLSVEEAMTSLKVLQSVENTSIAGAIAGGFGNLLTASGLSLDGQNKNNAAISKGNELAASILSGINTMAGIQQAAEAQRLAIAKAAEAERVRQGKVAALNQGGLSSLQAYQSIAATQQAAIAGVNAAIGDIWSLASAHGLTLQAQPGQTGNTAQFGVDGAGKFAGTYNQISGNRANAPAFKDAFWAKGGVYDRTYGQSSTLASLADQVSVAAAELERQRDLVRALGATPAFASGGYHSGGLRLVGERGPELEVTGPSRIYSADQTRTMLGGGGSTARLEALVAKQAEQLEAMRYELRAIATSSAQTANTLKRVTPDGNSLQTVVAA